MYCKVLIVDDEYIMRQGMRHMMEWEKEGYKIVGEAANGEEALRMMEECRPDIVLCDIVMPMLDGLEFSGIVKQRFPEVKLIILSGYDDFEYVKQTLLNGACDYILKASLNPQNFLTVLDKTAATIPGMCLSKGMKVSVGEKLTRYINGYDVDLTEGDFKERFFHSQCRLLLTKNGKGTEWSNTMRNGLMQKLGEFWEKQEAYETEVLLPGEDMVAVLLNYRIRDEETLQSQVKACVEHMCRYFPDCFWVLGDSVEMLAGMPESIRRGREYLDFRFYYPDTSLLVAEEITEPHVERFPYEAYAADLKSHHFAEALQRLDTYVTYACEQKMEEYLLKNTVKNLLYNFIVEKEKADGTLSVNKAEYFRKIDRSGYAKIFLEVFGEIKKQLDAACQNEKQPDVMAEILTYIRENAAGELDLAEIAKRFNYNYNYLSTYFNQRMHESFSEYLNRIRIEKACELLTDHIKNYSIADISVMVGYSDPSYFTRIFKQQTGSTPSVWKRKNGGKG